MRLRPNKLVRPRDPRHIWNRAILIAVSEFRSRNRPGNTNLLLKVWLPKRIRPFEAVQWREDFIPVNSPRLWVLFLSSDALLNYGVIAAIVFAGNSK